MMVSRDPAFKSHRDRSLQDATRDHSNNSFDCLEKAHPFRVKHVQTHALCIGLPQIEAELLLPSSAPATFKVKNTR